MLGVDEGAAAGLAHEREVFLRLRASDEAAALRYLFFAERGAHRPAALKGIQPLDLQQVGVVGGGTMGSGIAAALLAAGLRVTLSERDDTALQRGLETVRGLVEAGARRGHLPDAAVRDRLDRLTPWQLTALHDLVTLPGSLILGLAVLEGRIDAATAHRLARLDEDYQAEQWGRDDEAEAAAAARLDAMRVAERLLALLVPAV